MHRGAWQVQTMGLQRVGHDLQNKINNHTYCAYIFFFNEQLETREAKSVN